MGEIRRGKKMEAEASCCCLEIRLCHGVLPYREMEDRRSTVHGGLLPIGSNSSRGRALLQVSVRQGLGVTRAVHSTLS